jgi:hypothetical protein
VTDEKATGYLAYGLEQGRAQPEPSEDLQIRRVPFRELVSLCIEGEVTDAFTHLMVFAAKEKASRGALPEHIGKHLC